MSYKPHFSRFLTSDPNRLHAAAHSHHPWPDVTFAAHQQSWEDAARLHDDKWDLIFGEVLPEAQHHIAGRIGLPDPATVVFAPNTHELVVRLMSSLPRPARVLTTDAEFHSFARQLRRWEEAGVAVAEVVPSAPLATFADRFAAAASAGNHDLVFFSHVMFDSGYVVEGLASILDAIPAATPVVVDAYHGFMAVPTDFSALADRAFYVAGGYKYAMAGEGVCFMHCPPGYIERPVDTGWLAGFAGLAQGPGAAVEFASDARRFLGATFDPSGLYRFNAVQRWLAETSLSVEAIHDHVSGLQDSLLGELDGILGEVEATPRGHFLSFRRDDAGDIYRRLHDAGVITDFRGDRLRIGLGLYHDAADIGRLAAALRAAVKGP